MSSSAAMTTTSKSSKSSSSSSSSQHPKDHLKSSKKPLPPPIVALPSMSSHLFSLPHAKNIASLPVHPSQSAQRHAESEAKLKKALERNIARQNSQPAPMSSHYPPRPMMPTPVYSEPSSPSSHSPPIMMRTRPKPKFG